MAHQKRPGAVYGAPLCVSKAYKQAVVYGQSELELEVDEHTTFSGYIGPVQKGILRFLNCCEKGTGAHANAVWDEVQKLTGLGDAYEREAAWLLSEALWGRQQQGYTRTELRQFDNAVVEAANALSQALKRHPDFSRESAAVNWPDEHAKRMATALRGLPQKHATNQLWPGMDMHSAIQDAFFAGVFRNLSEGLWPWGSRLKDALFFLMAELSPTMAEMLRSGPRN